MSTMADTTAAPTGPGSDCTRSLSSLTMSGRSRTSRFSEEYPAPRSSIATRQLRSR